MIVTTSIPYGVVKGMLKKWKKIGVVACNSCARTCETGGKKILEEYVQRLRNDGFEVVDEDLVPMACYIDLAKKGDYKGDYLIILACDSGVATYQSIFPTKRIIPANNTIGLGSRDRNGNIYITKKF